MAPWDVQAEHLKQPYWLPGSLTPSLPIRDSPALPSRPQTPVGPEAGSNRPTVLQQQRKQMNWGIHHPLNKESPFWQAG